MPTFTAEESSLSSWAGPYVTEMLGRGQALAGMPYQAYMGPLTAGRIYPSRHCISRPGRCTSTYTHCGTDYLQPYVFYCGGYARAVYVTLHTRRA
jgi:hypothetical protein